MEAVWGQAFEKVGVAPEAAAGVVLTEAIYNPQMSKEQIVQRCFEKLNVQKVWVGSQPSMALFAAGKTTGLAVECGHGLTQSMPIFEGMKMNHGKDKNQIGGNSLNQFLAEQLGGDDVGVQAAKEQACYVSATSANFASEQDSAAAAKATLPDGREVEIPGKTRVLVPEMMFQPGLNGLECKSLPEAAWGAIQAVEVDCRADLGKNIIISGGNSMFAGFADRMKAEITNLAPAGSDIVIHAGQDRKNAVWKGTSIVSDNANFANN